MGTARRIASLFALLILVAGSLQAQDEYTLSQQGFLTKTGGEPVDSMLSMTFKLYKGGTAVWTETHPSVQVTDGNYEVALGSVTPFDTVSFDVPVELGIKIGGDAEMNPRQQLRASPRALTLQNFRVNRVNVGGSGPTVNLIGGHELNEVGAGVSAATISGGGTQSFPNQVNGAAGTVGGGTGNQANGLAGTVSGGQNNVAQAANSTVGGGSSHQVHGSSGTISGGFDNHVQGEYGTVGGGWDNSASGGGSTVGGGKSNTASAEYATVVGGLDNIASGQRTSIGGGSGNQITQQFGVIGGGQSNSVLEQYAFIGGGWNNESSGFRSVVTGGQGNVASGSGSSIGGGAANTASNNSATVSGGTGNSASGSLSSVPGGEGNSARGYSSLAAGYHARAIHNGSFVWNDRSIIGLADSLVSTAENQFLVRAAGGFGINDNNPFAPLHVTKNNIGVSADDVLNDVILAEDADATIGIYSNPGGTWGSGINLVEMSSCGTLPCAPLPDFENMWSIVRATSGSGNGLSFRYGTSTNYGSNSGKFAVYPNGDASVVGTLSVAGNLSVTGALSKGSGSFKIDHPLDPENKYLYHSFVESPDMMNVYNGNVILDDDGAATIELPSYFEALNRDFRYQLTTVGGYASVFVEDEVAENRFRIAGGTPGLKVSWQVTGVRKDPYAEMHPIEVEVEKPEAERGTYLHPEAYGRSATH